MSHLQQWIDDEIALAEPLDTKEREQYQQALSKTFHAAQLRWIDAVDELAEPFRSSLLRRADDLQRAMDHALNSSLRAWFRDHR